MTTISVTLDNATFSATPIAWSVTPPGGAPVVTLTHDPETISFQVPAPSHFFHPWVFRILVDAENVKGISSLVIILARSENSDPKISNLKYFPIDGTFQLLDNASDPSQDGIALVNELVLINPLPGGNFQINLSADDHSEVRFDSNPIRWSSGSQPPWITLNPLVENPPEPPPQLSFSIDADNSGGQSIGLRFAIVVQGLTVLSPDPILINATIGDG
jgi:hypothetical protein